MTESEIYWLLVEKEAPDLFSKIQEFKDAMPRPYLTGDDIESIKSRARFYQELPVDLYQEIKAFDWAHRYQLPWNQPSTG